VGSAGGQLVAGLLDGTLDQRRVEACIRGDGEVARRELDGDVLDAGDRKMSRLVRQSVSGGLYEGLA